MTEYDGLSERKKANEEDYFRKKDRELIEKMRAAAAADQARKDLGARTGLNDPALVQELQDLGFTPDTVSLLPLMPVLHVAWAEGGVTPAERDLLIQLARARGIADGSPGDQRLSDMIARRPAPEVFAKAARLIRAMLDVGPKEGGINADDLIHLAESIASASGGLLGIGKVSGEERAILAQITTQLKGR